MLDSVAVFHALVWSGRVDLACIIRKHTAHLSQPGRQSAGTIPNPDVSLR